MEGARAEAILSRWLASVVDDDGEDEEEEDRSEAMHVKRQQKMLSVQLFQETAEADKICCPFNFFNLDSRRSKTKVKNWSITMTPHLSACKRWLCVVVAEEIMVC